MKVIKNTSMQGVTVHFGTPEGPKVCFFKSKETKEIPDSWTSKVLKSFVNRRMFTVKHIQDAPAPISPIKQIRKYKKNSTQESD